MTQPIAIRETPTGGAKNKIEFFALPWGERLPDYCFWIPGKAKETALQYGFEYQLNQDNELPTTERETTKP